MKKKLALLMVVVAMVAVISVFALGSSADPDPYVDPWDATAQMSDEELIAIGEEILRSDQGSWPDNAFAACFRLMDIDPELAEAAFEHLESHAKPVERPENNYEDVPSQQSDEQDRFGVSFRDGNGEYTVYYDFDKDDEDLDISSEPESGQESFPNGDGEVAPYNYNDYNPVANPKNGRRTSTICKIYTKKGRFEYEATGFFLSNTVVATAAHVVYNSKWDGQSTVSAGWADEIYIVQAYAPTSGTPEPYGRVYGNNKDMTKGANWAKNGKFPDDADWGAFSIRGTMQGSYSCLPRKSITPKTFLNQNITTYGYPSTSGVSHSLYYINGKTTTKPSSFSTYRVLYSTDTQGGDADCWHGVSGGPLLDASGNVVGIFIGDTSPYPDVKPKRAMAVGMDSYLYEFFTRYK